MEYLSSQEVADDERKEFSEIVIQEGNDLSKILDRLIHYIKKEDNSLEVLDLTKFNYTELIESRIRKFQLDFTEKNINVIKNGLPNPEKSDSPVNPKTIPMKHCVLL